jgi:hypothetical protein
LPRADDVDINSLDLAANRSANDSEGKDISETQLEIWSRDINDIDDHNTQVVEFTQGHEEVCLTPRAAALQAARAMPWQDAPKYRDYSAAEALGTVAPRRPGISWMSGWTKFTGKRMANEEVAKATAAYSGVDTWGADPVEVQPVLPIGEYILNRIFGVGQKRHRVMHRAALRFHRSVVVVKAMVEAVKCAEKAPLTSSDNDRAALKSIVKKIVTEAIEEGGYEVFHNGEQRFIDIHRCQACFYMTAVCAAYYLKDESDEFWQRLAGEGQARAM